MDEGRSGPDPPPNDPRNGGLGDATTVGADDANGLDKEARADVDRMLRARDGDGEAFAALFEAHLDRVFGFLARLVGDRTAAEDLAQETFIRAWKARDRYEPTARFSTWLYRIARNLAYNFHRDRRTRRTFAAHFGPGSDSADGGTIPDIADVSQEAPEAGLVAAELTEAVEGALAALPEAQREALLLYRDESLSYAEIGVIVGLSKDAVKSLLARARSNLRQTLGPFWARLRRELGQEDPGS